MTNPFQKKKSDVNILKDIEAHINKEKKVEKKEEIRSPPKTENPPVAIAPDNEPVVRSPPTYPEPKKIIQDDLKVKKIKKRIKINTRKSPLDINRALIFISITAIMGLIFLYQMVETASTPLAMILVLFGMLCFLPLGLIFGKLFLDPYVRCKILRRTRGKNYGMVYFVHKGGQRVDIRIKNLDEDVVVHDTKLWVLEKGGIYYLDRDDALVRHAIIEPENVVTSPNNVPILFLEPESMLPLRFHETATKSNPQQVGATTLGYVNNQIAKNLFFKRSMQTFYILMLVLQAMNITGLIVLYDALVGI